MFSFSRQFRSTLIFFLVLGSAPSHAGFPGCEIARVAPPSPRTEQLTVWTHRELASTHAQRGGLKRRAVWLKTASLETLAVARKLFARHGIEVLRVPEKGPNETDSDLYSALLGLQVENVAVLSILTEGENYVITARTKGDVRQYSHPESASKAEQGPVSAVEMAISKYIVDQIHYLEPRGFTSQPIPMNRPIDFAVDPAVVLAGRETFADVMRRSPAFANLMHSVFNEGAFLRAPLNRRQGHIYMTGLHGGTPMTPKSSPSSETAYLVHDLTHELIPDLLLGGAFTSPLQKKVYVAHRAISEAVAVSVADIWFSSLSASGKAPANGAPKLHAHLKLDFSSQADLAKNLKRLVKANTDLFLKGDERAMRELLDGTAEGEEAFRNHRDSMAPVFTADMYWNGRNVSNLAGQTTQVKEWTDAVRPHFAEQGLKRETIQDVVRELGLKDQDSWNHLVDQVFEKTFTDRLEPLLQPKPILLQTERQRLARSATRYFAGQMALFAKFRHVAETAAVEAKITAFLHDKKDGMDVKDVNDARHLYEGYLDLLLDRNQINADDHQTYRELYPHFEPSYVVFDEYLGRKPIDAIHYLAPEKKGSGNTLIKEAEQVMREMKSTQYAEFPVIDEATGNYQLDCSWFVWHLLHKSSPEAYLEMDAAVARHARQHAQVPPDRPWAKSYVTYFDLLTRGVEKSARWSAVPDARTLEPGDVVAWLTPEGSQSIHTGHIMIVRERPRLNPENPDELLVPIIDSTSTGHGPADVRKKGGATGVGQGLIGLQLDSNGSPVAYRWSGGRSPKAQTTTIRVGRLAQKPQP